jgi:hypothetical protein
MPPTSHVLAILLVDVLLLFVPLAILLLVGVVVSVNLIVLGAKCPLD